MNGEIVCKSVYTDQVGQRVKLAGGRPTMMQLLMILLLDSEKNTMDDPQSAVNKHYLQNI